MTSEKQIFWRTVLAVGVTGLLCFGVSAAYDAINGGPDARQSAINTNDFIHGLDMQQARSECATSYATADSASEALLVIAFGELAQVSPKDQKAFRNALDNVHDATDNRIHFLKLRYKTNEFCDPAQPGGARPLAKNKLPPLPK